MTQDFSQKRAANFIPSPNAGFVFPMPEIIKNIDPAETLSVDAEGNKTISKLELLKAMFASAKKAWEEGIQPHITEIRKDPSGSSTAKGEGLDFFTKADSASEKIIKQYLIDKFGTETLRIFAEEINDYTGNLASQITVRIDPIDGTEVFKSGKPDWGIMIGVYKGAPIEQQQMAVVYYPEYNQVMYHIDKLETFIADTHTAEIKTITAFPHQDDTKGLVVSYWQHTDLAKRGNLNGILDSLEDIGTINRPMNSSAGDIREAMLAGGKWVIITEGGNQVDFIAYTPLVRLGYTIYDWEGNECNPDDPEVAQKKTVVVPRGKAGQKILETIKQVA